MNNFEFEYLKLCKKLVEEKLGWLNSNDWKQRDYLNLIEVLEKETSVTLSLSTIKRIWKTGYNGTPHPSTLEVFALFLGYKSWLDFKEDNKQLLLKAPSALIKKKPVFNKKKIILYTVIILLAGMVYYIPTSNRSKNKPKKGLNIPDSVVFSCKNSVSTGVPNTVIFNYDVSGIDADSFFIQQSWNKFRRDKIRKTDKNLTSLYYYPGYHRAKLIANDSIIKETMVKIYTKGWLSLARFGYSDNSPIYIRDNSVISDGMLHVSKGHLLLNKVEINNNTMVSYFLINDFKNINSTNFSFETRVKCDSLINITCPHIGFCIYGEEDIIFIPLIAKGCEGNITVKVGEMIKNGKNNDLSAFGVNVYSFQKFELSFEKNRGFVCINSNLVLEFPINKGIGNIIGFNFNFSGTGSIDYIKLRDGAKKIVYENEFDTL